MAGAYFDKQTVLDGLYTAMEFGAPNDLADRATFFMPRTSTTSGNTNEDGVPFNPQAHRTFSALVKKVVPCAIEYIDAEGKIENLGIMVHSRVRLTVLDPDYSKIKGFEFVVIAGQKYFYSKEAPIIGMGPIDVHTIYAKSEDEA